MTKITYFIYVLVFLFFLSACKSTFKVQSERIYQKSFSRFRSFKFFNPNNMPEANFAFSDTNKKHIFDAIAYEMKIRGFKSNQEADLMIKIQGGTSREVENKSPSYYPYDYGYYGYPYYWHRNPWLNDDISKKTTMIIIDVLDAETQKLLWHGTGNGVLSEKPGTVEEDIKRAVAQIFSEFPVQPGDVN